MFSVAEKMQIMDMLESCSQSNESAKNIKFIQQNKTSKSKGCKQNEEGDLWHNAYLPNRALNLTAVLKLSF